MALKPLIVRKYGDSYKIILCQYDVWKQKTKRNIEMPIEWQDQEVTSKEDCNIIRAKNKVTEYAKCNEWDWFVTLTLDKKKQNRYDLHEYIKDLGQFIRNIRRDTDTELKYLLIPEQHKDGAWHIHGYFKGLSDSQVTMNAYGYYNWIEYSKRFGYCSLDKIKDKNKCDSYITKYISKDLGGTAVEKNKKLYYVTRGLNTAETIHTDYVAETAQFKCDYENEFVKIKWVDSLEQCKAIISLM